MPDAAVGEDEPDGVIDPAAGHFIGGEEQWGDGVSGRIGTGAVFAATGEWIDAGHVPDGQATAVEDPALMLARHIS